MKYHYIYFIIIPLLIALSLFLPFTIEEYGEERYIRNGFDDDPTAVLFSFITLLATALLLIRNRYTALIGTILYFILFGFSILIFYVIHAIAFGTKPGIGSGALILIMIITVVVASLHTVKLYRSKETITGTDGIIDDNITL